VELYLAWRIERNFSKQEIMGAYLNRVYFGSGFYGVEAAAQAIAPLVFKAPRTVSKWLYDERKGRTPQLPRVTD
jgi:hypothetical protein